jgi:hypothetical protein
MRWVLLVAIAACSFERTGDDLNGNGAGPGVDAAPVAGCTVHHTGDVDSRNAIGGTGGNTQPDLVCPAGELPIGASFETSQNSLAMFNNEQVVVTVHIRCGRIERSPQNKMLTTPTNRITRSGTNCADPLVVSSEQTCPSGAVLHGIRGNASGGQFSSINSIRLECAELRTDGSVTSVITALDFRATTGDFGNDLETSICSGGEAIVAFGGKSDCAQDQIFAKCSSLVCD